VKALSYGLAGVAVVSLLGEGGATPWALLAWHGMLLATLLTALAVKLPDRGASAGPLAGFACFCAVAWAGAFLAPYGFAAWLTLLELSAWLAIAWLASRVGPSLLDRLWAPLMIAATGQALLAIWQYYSAADVRPAGTLLNPNHLGAWLVPVLCLTWGRERFLTVRIAATVPILFALVLTGSRGAFVALVVGALVLAWPVWRAVSGRTRLWVVGAVALVALLAVGSQWQRLREADPFRYQRLRIWSGTLQVASESPWLGTGPGQFAAAARNAQFPDGNGPLSYDRHFSSPHSDLFRIPAEFGWLGLAAIAATLFLAARSLSSRPPEDRAPGRGAVAGLLALGTQGIVDHLTQRPALYVLAAILVGAVLSRRIVATPRSPARFRVALAALLLTVFVVGDLAPYRAWMDYTSVPAGRLDAAAEQRLTRSLALNPTHPDSWSRRAESIAADTAGWDAAAYRRARDAAERAVRYSAEDSRTHLALARVEALAARTLFRDRGTRDRAVDSFLRAEALARFDPFIPLERAGLLLDTGEPGGARRAAERALALEPNSVLPRLMLAGALVAQGGQTERNRVETLLREARAAAESGTDWVDRSDYAREMLTLDTELLQRIERAQAPPADP